TVMQGTHRGYQGDRGAGTPDRRKGVAELLASGREDGGGSHRSGVRVVAGWAACDAASASSSSRRMAVARIGSTRPSVTTRSSVAWPRATYDGSVSGAVAAISARWARTVFTSPRTIGTASALWPSPRAVARG